MKLFRLDEEPKRLRLEQEAKGAALVVIDCLTRVHGLDENSRTDMQIVTRALTAIAVQTGATVLVLHHFRKAGIGDSERRAGQMMRGTGDLHALARAVIGVKRPKKGNELHLEPENNYASPDELEPFAVRFTIEPDANGKKAARFEYVGSSEDADASALDEKVMEVLKGSDTPMVGAAIRAAVGGNGTAVDAAVKRLAQTDRIELVKFDREDAAGRKRHLEGWRVCRR